MKFDWLIEKSLSFYNKVFELWRKERNGYIVKKELGKSFFVLCFGEIKFEEGWVYV